MPLQIPSPSLLGSHNRRPLETLVSSASTEFWLMMEDIIIPTQVHNYNSDAVSQMTGQFSKVAYCTNRPFPSSYADMRLK